MLTKLVKYFADNDEITKFIGIFVPPIQSLMPGARNDIIDRLKQDLLLWEGFRPLANGAREVAGLQAIAASFPHARFPAGAVHEFLSSRPEEAAASGGFITGLISALTPANRVCLWISARQTVFPAALKIFGIAPDRVIFVNTSREKNVLWAAEEALKSRAVTTVVAEVHEMDFMPSRRLQLAVERSQALGFILRTADRHLTATACTARWRVSPASSRLENNLPGVGFPRWDVELLKIRNGRPGRWTVEWSADRFTVITENAVNSGIAMPARKAG